MKAHRWPWHPICSPELNESPLGMFPTMSMRPLRLPPRSPMVHSALPRQLIPRAVTEDALHMMGRRALKRILEAFGGKMDTNLVVKMGDMTCHVQKLGIPDVIPSDGIEEEEGAVTDIFMSLNRC